MILYVLSLLGVAVFAVSGALEAGSKKFDLMGVTVIAVITALGGGTIRDILLDVRPLAWISDPNYLIVALVSAVLTFFCSRFRKPPAQFLLLADALGLALFTIIGTTIAQQANVGMLIGILMGTISGAAGGVLRDMLCAEVPLLFRPSETLYATASICGSTVYLLLEFVGVDPTVAALIGMVGVAVLRITAIVWGLRLPEYRASNGKV